MGRPSEDFLISLRRKQRKSYVMAKKTIISDFSALKGKVTFSEKTPDSKLSAKGSSAPSSKPKDSEKGLKVGQ